MSNDEEETPQEETGGDTTESGPPPEFFVLKSTDAVQIPDYISEVSSESDGVPGPGGPGSPGQGDTIFDDDMINHGIGGYGGTMSDRDQMQGQYQSQTVIHGSHGQNLVDEQIPEEESEDHFSPEKFEELLDRCHIPDQQKEEEGKKHVGIGKDELAQNYQHPNSKVYTTYTKNKERKERLGQQATMRLLQELRNDWEHKKSLAEQSKETLKTEEKRLRDLEQGLVTGSGSNTNGNSSSTTNQISPETIFVQSDEVEAAWRRLAAAEKTRDAAELKLHKVLSQSAPSAQSALTKKDYEFSMVAPQRQSDEVQRAKRELDQLWHDDLAELDRKAEKKQTEEQKAQAAEYNRKLNNKKHLTKGLKMKHELGTQAQEAAKEKHDHRTKSLLQLKGSINDINSKIQASNFRKNQAKKKLEAENEAQKSKLLEAGFNPYELFRKQEIQKKVQQKELEMAAATQMRREKLLNKVVTDQEKQREVDAERRRIKEFEIAYQREQAGQAADVKITNYLQKVTLNHTEVVDPTGKALRIDPSKITVQKTGGFGLGKAGPEELELVETQYERQKKRVDK